MDTSSYNFHQLARDIVGQTIYSLDKLDEDASEDLADTFCGEYGAIVAEVERSLTMSWLKKHGELTQNR